MPREIEQYSELVVPTGSFQTEIDPLRLFGNSSPLEVDVGCGYGRFLLARAARFPETNFLGLDRLLRRMRKVAKKIHKAGFANVRLLRIEASYAIEHMLPASSVTAFFVLFPDPWPKKRHHGRRLFNEEFMNTLHSKLVPGGVIHAATDHEEYFEAIHDLFINDSRFSEIPPFIPTEEERTGFELIFEEQKKKVGRCSIRKKPAPAP